MREADAEHITLSAREAASILGMVEEWHERMGAIDADLAKLGRR